MDTQKQLLCLLLHAQPSLGVSASRALLQRFSSPEVFWAASPAQLPPTSRSREGARQALTSLWRSGPSSDAWRRAQQWHEQLQRQSITLLEPEDADFPSLLREIPDGPAALYVRGDPKVLQRPQIAIVGSRNAGHSGLETAAAFARELAARGLLVCSGLALGIDGAAHRGALQADGVSIGVLGCGVDKIYPRRHDALAEAMLERGALVSEFPLGTKPLPHHFPQRNRLIAGMCLGTLVVEAAAQSGSLITARLALDYNREVFAIPGSIHSPNSKGSHELLRQGAKLVETTDHIIEEIGALVEIVVAESAEPNTAAGVVALEPLLASLLKLIDYHPTPLDTIIERSGQPPSRLSGMLLELELDHWIECQAGAYQRCR